MQLTCYGEGEPVPEVSWLHQARFSRVTHTSPGQSTATLSAVRPHHSLLYSCSASNSVGTALAWVRLIVYVPACLPAPHGPPGLPLPPRPPYCPPSPLPPRPAPCPPDGAPGSPPPPHCRRPAPPSPHPLLCPLPGAPGSPPRRRPPFCPRGRPSPSPDCVPGGPGEAPYCPLPTPGPFTSN